MMEKSAFVRLLKLVLASMVVFCFLFTPILGFTQVHAAIQPSTKNVVATSNSEPACIPLDIVIAVDQSSTMNDRDPNGLRIEAIKYLIKILTENEKKICLTTTDRISVVYIGDTDKTTVQIKLTPVSDDLLTRLQPENLGNRDINAALEDIDLELKQGESSRPSNAKSIVIVISDWLAAQCPTQDCMPYKIADRLLTDTKTGNKTVKATKSIIDDMVKTESTPPIFRVIGIPPKNAVMGDFSKNEGNWNTILGTNGKFENFVKEMVFLSEDLVSIVQEYGDRDLDTLDGGSFTIAPFTENYDIFVFCDDPSANMIPVFESDTFNSVLPGSLNRSFEQFDNSEGSAAAYFSLTDAGVGGRVNFQGACERTIIFTESSPMTAKQVVLEKTIPKVYDTGNPNEDKYKLILTYENNNLNWTALCPAYDYKFQAEINDPNGQSIPWSSDFTCQAEKQRFISSKDLPNDVEGTYSIRVTGTASSSSIDPQPILSYSGTYTVKVKQRIGFISVSPKPQESTIRYSIHGSLFSKYWLKEQPLTVSIKLMNKETGVGINPLTLNNNKALKTITASIVENNSELTEHDFTLLQSPTDPSVYSGTFSDFDPAISDYSMYVSLPQDSFDQNQFSQDNLGIQFNRQDDLSHNPITYYSIFAVIFLALLTWAIVFLRSFSHPLRGNLNFFMPGNLSVPIARINLAPGHKKNKELNDTDLQRLSPILTGISKLDVEAVYQDGSLNAVNLEIYYPDMDVPQKEFLGVTTILHDAETNQYELGTTIAESMKSSAKTKTGSLIVFTKE